MDNTLSAKQIDLLIGQLNPDKLFGLMYGYFDLTVLDIDTANNEFRTTYVERVIRTIEMWKSSKEKDAMALKQIVECALKKNLVNPELVGKFSHVKEKDVLNQRLIFQFAHGIQEQHWKAFVLFYLDMDRDAIDGIPDAQNRKFKDWARDLFNKWISYDRHKATVRECIRRLENALNKGVVDKNAIQILRDNLEPTERKLGSCSEDNPPIIDVTDHIDAQLDDSPEESPSASNSTESVKRRAVPLEFISQEKRNTTELLNEMSNQGANYTRSISSYGSTSKDSWNTLKSGRMKCHSLSDQEGLVTTAPPVSSQSINEQAEHNVPTIKQGESSKKPTAIVRPVLCKQHETEENDSYSPTNLGKPLGMFFFTQNGVLTQYETSQKNLEPTDISVSKHKIASCTSDSDSIYYGSINKTEKCCNFFSLGLSTGDTKELPKVDNLISNIILKVDNLKAILYLFTDDNNVRFLNLLDPRKWKFLENGSLPIAVANPIVLIDQQYLTVIGGIDKNKGLTNYVQQYDFEEKSWSKKQPMLEVCTAKLHSGIFINDNITIFGNEYCCVYSQETDNWKKRKHELQSDYSVSACTVGDSVIVASQANSRAVPKLFSYDIQKHKHTLLKLFDKDTKILNNQFFVMDI